MVKNKIISWILIAAAVLLFFLTPFFPFDELIVGAIGVGLGIKELFK